MTPVNEENKTENTAGKTSNGARLLAGFACILALGALIAALYSVQLNLKTHKAWKQAQQDKMHFKTQLQQIKTKEKALQREQHKLQTAIEDIPADIRSQLHQNPQWLLLKARYYLETAQMNSQWSHDSTSSIALLQAADELLSHTSTPDINNARQVIAKEIAQLQAIPHYDKAGLLSQLEAAQTSIDTLDLQKPDVPVELPVVHEDASWQGRFQTNLALLKKLVVIQHHDETIQPVASPLLQLLIKENVRLALQQAQWAVLNNDPLLYQQAISNAIDTLKRSFCIKKQAAVALVTQLHTLEKMQFTGEKPVIGQAIPLLTQAIEAPVNGEEKP